MTRGSSLLVGFLGMVLAGMGLVTFAGCGGSPAKAPTAYGSYNSPGGTFACEYPEG